MVQVSEWYGWHFACRDRQKAAYRNVCLHALRGYLGIHVDFGQSRTLPIGPKEGGRWWYANARVSVNVLVAYVWGCGMEAPMYITYLGNVLDHTPDYAIAVLHDIIGRVWTNQVGHVALRTDIGTHFRAARMWGWWLHTFPEEMYKIKVDAGMRSAFVTSVNYFPDGHGKEKIDGQIGRIGRRSADGAKKT